MILHGNDSSKPNIPGTFASPFDYLQNQQKAKELQTMDSQKKQQEQQLKKMPDKSTSHLQQFDSYNRMSTINHLLKK